MPTNPHLDALARHGVSIWLDDLSRSMIADGRLQQLVLDKGVVGVTTNPTIFAGALSKGVAYAEQVRTLAADGTDVDEAVFAITTRDVRDACDVLRPVYDATEGEDGRVSIEVDPGLARDTQGTIEKARRLWTIVDRPNVMIKIPATVEGLPAIASATEEGINVNVTLIFSLDRYRGVMNAYLTGLEQARQAGRDLSTIHSVASFFVSRVDVEIDGRLDGLGSQAANELRGRPASRMPAWLIRPSKRPSAPHAGPTFPTMAPTGSVRCGHPPASRIPPTPTRCMSPSSLPPAPSTRCRARRWTPSPITQ